MRRKKMVRRPRQLIRNERGVTVEDLKKAVEALEVAKDAYDSWYDSTPREKRHLDSERECELRSTLCREERNVINAAKELVRSQK